MLNLDRLRALHAVSAHGSIIAAAETLNVTTSAVSQQLAKLEAETGQTLLERHGRGVRLTDAAATLVSRTQRVLSLLGVPEGQIETISFGKEKPRNPGHDETAWAENRRADIQYAGE